MTTMAQRHVNDLHAVLYRLLVQGATSRQRPADHGEGSGYFEMTSVLDPFGSVFRMMTGKQETGTKKDKTR
ncbi:hypothetical protein [Niabella aurantiaca]|uniref:hypothetical protein n=1 Tax=Niabella aurantiaca TaxID=379900 RepID=UPI000366D723|nr:hypothetical protein [Niabella aurantiaca]